MQTSNTLDPVLLGRPLPLFDHVAKQLARQVTQRLQHSGHRNVHIAVTHAHWLPLRPSQHPDCSTASIARASVLAFMDARYGFHASTDTETDAELPPISATEQRITANTQALVVEALHEVLPLPPNAHTEAQGHAQRWQWSALLDIENLGAHPITIALDSAHSHSLEQRIHALRQAQQGPRPAALPAAAPLHVHVVAHVAEKAISAADLHNLRPGSVLPIALGRATVLLNDSAMLTASVAEHKGKLHLTAFENLE